MSSANQSHEMSAVVLPGKPTFGWSWIFLLLPLAYLWWQLIDNLRHEWTTNPQYGYGWLVPVLCLGMICRKWLARPATPDQNLTSHSLAFRLLLVIFVALAFLYLPVRLVELATPEWRPVQWALGFITIGLTLCLIGLGSGMNWLKRLAFPIAFFAVAIPWPTLIEQPIIQMLTRISAAVVVEVLAVLGIPAVAHGNVLEVSSGVVGINEACSGIRSFQSSLMISLFLGEFYGFDRWRRGFLVPIGFALALMFNIGRMAILTIVAAKQGVEAIGKYHDQAGLTITILCTLGLWAAAWFLSRRMSIAPPAPTSNRQPSNLPAANSNAVGLLQFAISLLVWIGVVETSAQWWYQNREARIVTGPDWAVHFPSNNPTLKVLPIDPTTAGLLRFDEGRQAAWQESDGTRWQGFYFDWRPGRVAGYLAKRHTPEICLTATGLSQRSGPDLEMLQVHGLELPVRSYVFASGRQLLHVFHCRWESGAPVEAYVQHESARYNLIRAVWAGRGNKGQKVFEFVIFDAADAVQARQALRAQLEQVIKLAPLSPPTQLSRQP